jgi:hypothetical protein
VRHVATKYGTEGDTPPVDRAIARLAGNQYGVVALFQLLALGLSATAARSRVARGKLHRIHRGVYAVGHAHLTKEGRFIAAVLAYAPGSALSHLAAAVHWGLRTGEPQVIDVTSPRRARGQTGIRVHSARDLERTIWHGIPITTVARTIVDCAELLDYRGVERLIERADQLGLYDGRAVHEAMDGRRGAARINAVLGHWQGDTTTKSDTEELLFGICRAHGIPQPRCNVTREGAERDFVWDEQRVIAETDARSTHDNPGAWERDRLRDQAAIVAGWRVVRLTRRQIEERPDEVAGILRALLTRPPS